MSHGRAALSDGQVAEVVVRTLEASQKHATHWSTWEMAQQTGLSQSTVSHI